MKYLSFLLIMFALVFASCDLNSPDRSVMNEIPVEMQKTWAGMISQLKSGTGGVAGGVITSDTITLSTVAHSDDDIYTSVETKEIKAELNSLYPDVGYMVSGDLLVDGTDIVSGSIHFPGYTDSTNIENSFRNEIYDFAQDIVQDIESHDLGGGVIYPLWSTLFIGGGGIPEFGGGVLTGGFGTNTATDLGAAGTDGTNTHPNLAVLTNDLRDEHKAIIDDYIESEGIFDFIDAGLSASGNDQVRLISVTWGYNGVTEENDVDVTDVIFDAVENQAFMNDATFKLYSVFFGQEVAANLLTGKLPNGDMNLDGDDDPLTNPYSAHLAGAFGDPRWTVVQDIEE